MAALLGAQFGYALVSADDANVSTASSGGAHGAVKGEKLLVLYATTTGNAEAIGGNARRKVGIKRKYPQY